MWGKPFRWSRNQQKTVDTLNYTFTSGPATVCFTRMLECDCQMANSWCMCYVCLPLHWCLFLGPSRVFFDIQDNKGLACIHLSTCNKMPHNDRKGRTEHSHVSKLQFTITWLAQAASVLCQNRSCNIQAAGCSCLYEYAYQTVDITSRSKTVFKLITSSRGFKGLLTEEKQKPWLAGPL